MTDVALHAGLGWTVAGLVVAASFATSFLTAAFGIGGGAVLLAILASLMPPAALIPVHGVVQLGSNAGRACIMFRHRDQGVLLPFVLGSLAGVALGGSLVVQLPPSALQTGVGLFILWSVMATPPAFMRRSAAIAGGISSFLTMFFGGTGTFVVAYVKTLKFPAHDPRGDARAVDDFPARAEDRRLRRVAAADRGDDRLRLPWDRGRATCADANR